MSPDPASSDPTPDTPGRRPLGRTASQMAETVDVELTVPRWSENRHDGRVTLVAWTGAARVEHVASLILAPDPDEIQRLAGALWSAAAQLRRAYGQAVETERGGQ